MSSMLRACESAFTRMSRHDFRISWTTRLHRQEVQARLKLVLRPRDKQRVPPRPVQAAAQLCLRVETRQRMSTWM